MGCKSQVKKKAKTAGNDASNKENVSLDTNQRLELTLKEMNPLLPAPCTVPPDKAQHEHGEHENDVHIILSTLQHWYGHPEAGNLDTAEASGFYSRELKEEFDNLHCDLAPPNFSMNPLLLVNQATILAAHSLCTHSTRSSYTPSAASAGVGSTASHLCHIM